MNKFNVRTVQSVFVTTILAGLAACTSQPSVPDSGPGVAPQAVFWTDDALDNSTNWKRYNASGGSPNPAAVSVTADTEPDTGGNLDRFTVPVNFNYLVRSFSVTPGQDITVSFRAKTPINIDVKLWVPGSSTPIQTVKTGSQTSVRSYTFDGYTVPAGVTALEISLGGAYTGNNYAFGKFSATTNTRLYSLDFYASNTFTNLNNNAWPFFVSGSAPPPSQVTANVAGKTEIRTSPEPGLWMAMEQTTTDVSRNMIKSSTCDNGCASRIMLAAVDKTPGASSNLLFGQEYQATLRQTIDPDYGKDTNSTQSQETWLEWKGNGATTGGYVQPLAFTVTSSKPTNVYVAPNYIITNPPTTITTPRLVLDVRWGKASAIVPTTVTNITNAQNSPCGTENTNYFVRCYDLGPASILDGTHTIDVLMRPNATAGGNGYIQVSLDGLQIFRYDGPFGFPEDATNFSSNFGQPGRYKFDWWNGNTQRSSTIGSPPTNTNSNLKKGMQIMIHKYEVRRRL